MLTDDARLTNLLVAERQLIVREADGARIVRQLSMPERACVQRDGARLFTASIGEAPVQTPETLLMRDTLTPELQAAIDDLPEAFRQAVWLRDVEEFSYAEIAEMLTIPGGTVMSRISRGRRMLFERLKHRNPAHV